MPEPEAQRAIEALRARLLAQDAAASAELIRAYAPVWERIRSSLETLLAEVDNKQLTFGQVRRIRRYEDLLSQVQQEIENYSMFANGRITDAQRAALGLAQEGTPQVVGAALPRGVNLEILARVGLEWNTLPTQAFEAFLGVAGDGKPLFRLLASLGAEARTTVTQTLAEGIGLGYSPRRTAALVRDRVGMPLTRALTISRTETNRAFREASRMQYAANPDIVKGYKRIARRSSTTCFACIALDGTLYQTNEPLDEHPNGRCALVPVTVGYRDLGLDVPDTRIELPTARDWFRQQPESVQVTMMGERRFDAWKAGEFDLEQMAKRTRNDVWGTTATEKPLRELVS